MTATEPERRRDGTPADIAGLRIHYRHADDPDGHERTVDYMYRLRGITVAEGIAVKRKTPSDVSVTRLRMVADALGYGAQSVVQDDPEALQALIWLIRNVRNREPVQLVDLDDLDVLSAWADMLDSDGIALDFPPDLDAEAAQQAAELAAAMGPWLPRLQQAEVFGNAAALIARNRDTPDPDAPEETAGEESAGSAPSEQPAASE